MTTAKNKKENNTNDKLSEDQSKTSSDNIKEQFMNLSLNDLVLLAADIKRTFEEQGLSFLLNETSSSSNDSVSGEKAKEEKAMVRIKKIPTDMKLKIELIKLLASKMSWTLGQAKGSVEVLPLILKENVSLAEANALKEELSTISEVEIEVEIL